MPLRADATDETAGLDVTQHGEEAYIHERGMTAPIAEVQAVGRRRAYIEVASADFVALQDPRRRCGTLGTTSPGVPPLSPTDRSSRSAARGRRLTSFLSERGPTMSPFTVRVSDLRVRLGKSALAAARGPAPPRSGRCANSCRPAAGSQHRRADLHRRHRRAIEVRLPRHRAGSRFEADALPRTATSGSRSSRAKAVSRARRSTSACGTRC